jgi:hypothetical protein
MALEYPTKGGISLQAAMREDIFSFGIMIIEIITGRRDNPYVQLNSPQDTETSLQ